MVDDDTAQTIRIDAFFHRELVETAVDPYVLVGRDLVVYWAGPTIVEMLGWRPEDLVGRSIADLLAPDSLELAGHGLAELDRAVLTPHWLAIPVQVTARTAGSGNRDVDVTVRTYARDGFEGYLVQIHPAGAAERFGEVTRAILDDGDELEVLEMLPPLLAHDVPGTAVTIGVGWHGDGFSHVVGDDHGLLTLDAPARGDRAVFDRLVRSGDGLHGLTDALSEPTRRRARRLGYSACWGVPIIAHDDATPGVALVMWHWADNEPGEIVRGRVTRLVDLARLVLHWGVRRRRLAWEVTHDHLTRLLNRSAFIDVIGGTNGSARAVLFCDLDDFKLVNDRYGHRVGDRLLVGVARRLAGVCDPHVVARLSGDEFATLVHPCDRPDGAAGVAEAMRAALDEPISVDGHVATVGVSIGIAHDPSGRVGTDTLIDEADRMLRVCKGEGKNRVRSTTLTG